MPGVITFSDDGFIYHAADGSVISCSVLGVLIKAARGTASLEKFNETAKAKLSEVCVLEHCRSICECWSADVAARCIDGINRKAALCADKGDYVVFYEKWMEFMLWGLQSHC